MSAFAIPATEDSTRPANQQLRSFAARAPTWPSAAAIEVMNVTRSRRSVRGETHREIFHLVNSYQRLLADLPVGGPQPADMKNLRRIRHSLYAILRLDFDQEEELYLSLNEEYTTPMRPAETSLTSPDGPRPASVNVDSEASKMFSGSPDNGG